MAILDKVFPFDPQILLEGAPAKSIIDFISSKGLQGYG